MALDYMQRSPLSVLSEIILYGAAGVVDLSECKMIVLA